MPDEIVRLQIEGLAEVRAMLRDIDPRLAKGMQKANRAAADSVADAARGAYGAMFERHTGKHENAIRARSTQTSAAVALDESRAGAGGLFGQEFGTKDGKHPQFKPYVASSTGRGGAGYFFFPSVREELPHLMESYGEMLKSAISAVGV